MKNIIIFEDKDSSPSSGLLRYDGDLYTFAFTGSNGNLQRRCASAIKSGYETILVYIDLPVNNVEIVQAYEVFYRFARNYEQIRVLPIICVEEMLFRAISRVNQLRTKGSEVAREFCRIMSLFDKSLDEWIKACEGSEICRDLLYTNGVLRSVEKLFKHVFKDCVQACQENVCKAAKGLYYTQGCDCLGCDFRLQLREKAQLLWSSFYAIPIDISISGNTRTLDYDTVVKCKRQEFFDNLADAIHVERINLYPKSRGPVLEID